VSALFAAYWKQANGLKGDPGAIQAPLSDQISTTGTVFGREVTSTSFFLVYLGLLHLT
jgi:hypothetical protein